MRNNFLKIFFVGLVAILSTTTLYSQEKKLIGDWQGKLEINGVSLKIVFHIKNEMKKIVASLDSPDQGAFGIEADEIIIDDNNLKISISKIGGTYEGSLSESKNRITGFWKQGGLNQSLNLEKLSQKPVDPESLNFSQLWEGKLKVSAIELRLVLKIYSDNENKQAAYLDSPDQGVKNISVSSIEITETDLNFTVASIMGNFSGTFNQTHDTLTGTWKQGGQSLPLKMHKISQVTEVKRPQNPVAPFPYKVEEVEFISAEGNKLSGTLTYPDEGSNFPAVVLVSGSGPQDRDETIFNHKPFWIIADYLSRNGIAVLRYDDRGTGKSEGNFKDATTADFTIDAISAVNFLKERPEIDKNKIGIIGHSEGGIIGPMAAQNSDDVRFIIMLAGPGLPGKDILLLQQELIARVEGSKEEEIQRDKKYSAMMYELITGNETTQDIEEKLDKILDEYITHFSEEEKENPQYSKENMKQRISALTSPWFRYFLKYDPRPTLEQLTIPVLVLNGEKDLQVPSKENLEEIGKALKKAGNKSYKIMELPGLNHLFQHTETGAVSEYGKIEETFAPEALIIIKDWIKEVAK